MKREFLKNLGITDEEVINKILDENSNDRTVKRDNKWYIKKRRIDKVSNHWTGKYREI